MNIRQIIILLIGIICIIGITNKIITNNINKLKVTKINNFLSKKECKHIINNVKTFKSSTVISKNRIISSGRTSTSHMFKKSDKLISFIETRICKMFNIKLQQLEPIQLTKYTKGQEYKYHYDYFKQNNSNQRHYTIIIYLNDIPQGSGGTTDFFYGENFIPIEGNMIWWSNLNDDLTCNKMTLHSGKPILNDSCKYILTIWTRVNPL